MATTISNFVVDLQYIFFASPVYRGGNILARTNLLGRLTPANLLDSKKCTARSPKN